MTILLPYRRFCTGKLAPSRWCTRGSGLPCCTLETTLTLPTGSSSCALVIMWKQNYKTVSIGESITCLWFDCSGFGYLLTGNNWYFCLAEYSQQWDFPIQSKSMFSASIITPKSVGCSNHHENTVTQIPLLSYTKKSQQSEKPVKEFVSAFLMKLLETVENRLKIIQWITQQFSTGPRDCIHLLPSWSSD